MGNSKHRKNHSQKLNARKEKIKADQNRRSKYDALLMERIKEEMAKGALSNNTNINDTANQIPDSVLDEGLVI